MRGNYDINNINSISNLFKQMYKNEILLIKNKSLIFYGSIFAD